LLQGSVDRARIFLQKHATRIIGKDLSFQVHYWGITPAHMDNPVHKHHFYEVCYVLDGQGSYSDEDNVYPLEKGTLFLSRPEIWHQIRSRSGLYLLYVAFQVLEPFSSAQAALRYDALRHTRRFLLQRADDCPSALIWRGLMAQITQPHPPMAEATASLCHALLHSFQQTFAEERESSLPSFPAPRSSSMLLHQARLFVRDNLVRPLRLKDISDYLHISERHLSRLFSRELGRTFTGYIREERVRHAARLLRKTNLPIKQIARESGFANLHYFTRVFAEEKGVPPGRYRRESTSATDDPDE